MTGFTVHVEARAPEGADQPDAITRIDAFADALALWHGIAAADERGWEGRISVDAVDPLTAARIAVSHVSRAASDVGLAPWPVARVEAVRDDLADEDLERPTLPDVVSGPEAADILGVSQQRLHQLATTHPDFPRPLFELRAGKIWARAGIEAFSDRWERKPGRPRRRTSPAA